MKRVLSFLFVVLVCLVTMVGCGKEENVDVYAGTPATALSAQFDKEIKNEKDLTKLAESISQNKILDEMNLDIAEITNKDYAPGFKAEIKNFTKAVKVQPMIGSIPFIYYIFETDNAEELVKELKENADLRWNICTEADEMKISEEGNFVFFVMAPNSFEE